MFYILAGWVAPAVGVLTSNLLYLSSLKKVRQARVLRALGTLDPIALTMQFINTLAWIAYALVTHDQFLFASNALRCILALFYVVSLLELSVSSGKLEVRGKVEIMFLSAVTALVGEIFLVSMVLKEPESKELVAGILCTATTTLMYCAPLLNLMRVFREKTASLLHPPLVLTSLTNGTVWVCYGLFALKDPWVWVPQSLGVTASLAQLVAIIIFYKSDKRRRLGLAKLEQVDDLRVDHLLQEYSKNGPNSALLPMDFNSQWLQQRMELRNELVQDGPLDNHETTVTSLLGIPIPTEIKEVVLAKIARETNAVQVVVDTTMLATEAVTATAGKLSRDNSLVSFGGSHAYLSRDQSQRLSDHEDFPSSISERVRLGLRGQVAQSLHSMAKMSLHDVEGVATAVGANETPKKQGFYGQILTTLAETAQHYDDAGEELPKELKVGVNLDLKQVLFNNGPDLEMSGRSTGPLLFDRVASGQSFDAVVTCDDNSDLPPDLLVRLDPVNDTFTLQAPLTGCPSPGFRQ